MSCSLNNNNNGGRSSFLRSISVNSGRPPPPCPPIRRSSSISSQDDCRPTFKPPLNDEDEATPHGSIENVSIVSPTGEDRLSLEAMVAKASCVASTLINFDKSKKSTAATDDFPPPPPPQMTSSFMDRDQFLRRSLTLTSRADRVNLINSLTERISQRMSQQQQQNNKLVISVNGAIPATSAEVTVNKQLKSAASQQPAKSVASPEGEIYGFGMQFRESSKQYFDMSASYPTSEAVENQKFLDALSSKLLGKPAVESQSKLNAEIQSGSFNLRKTNGIVNDKSAPRF